MQIGISSIVYSSDSASTSNKQASGGHATYQLIA